MLKPFLIYYLCVLLFCSDYYVFCESNVGTNRQLVERRDDSRVDNDLQTCIGNFEIYHDKIIRTSDSREMGARYINKINVLTRDSCQRLCCETDGCDVFVFEEKTPGTCYLFECGSPENFKCKFTKYKNYTSAVLAINRHLTELESQIKLTQDEHELTSLRQLPEILSLSKFYPSTTSSPKSQQTMPNEIEHSPSQTVLSNINRQLVKRRDDARQDNDLQTCLDNFDVHEDKIIRTQDSREMGAKYINERDVLSREDCLRLCCETDNCDVFVFEEKSPGSCYLFECGTPEDFKCKFTKHKNYTSAVLAINRHLTELESQIKFTQHEHELTNLRQPSETQSLSKLHSSTTNSPKSLETIGSGIERPPSQTLPSKGDKCSQYQFKCHTSGECIGIYNACDGIPQCADGSDEAPELGCPTSTPSPVQTTQNPFKNEGKSDFKTIDEHKKDIAKSSVMNGQQPYPGDGSMISGYPQNIGPANSPVNAPVPNPYYGREGEGMINHHSEQWPSHLYHQNQGSSQIFNHKGNGIVPQKNEWYYPHPYVSQDLPQQPVLSQYGEQGPNYYDNMPYRMPPQGQPNWQGPHKIHEVGGQQVNEDGAMSRLDRIPVVNPPGPAEDYYEEVYRNRPYLPPRLPVAQNPALRQPIDPKMQETPMEMSNDDTGTKHDVPKKRPPTEPPKITTSKPKDVTPEHVSHRKVDKISAELKSKEVFAEEDLDGHNTTPSGAVLSLTMGLCMTGIMLIFVGCRMKVVKRRMRRGGKSPYAHDADFLVNGMYL